MNLFLSSKRKISRPLVLFVVGLMTALAVFYYFAETIAPWTAAVSVLLCIGAIFARYQLPYARQAAIVLAGISLAGAAWSIQYHLIYQNALQLSNQGYVIEGTVVDYPDVYEDYTRLELKITSLDGQAKRGLKTRLHLDGIYALQPGDALRVEASLEVPNNSPNFDARRYLNSHGVFFTASAEYADVIEGQSIPFSARLQRLARRIDEKLHEILPDEHAGLMSALIFGDETGLADSFETNLRMTGLSHITAVSGMNVAFLTMIVLALFRRKYGSIIAIPVVILFVLMTGSPASVVRAGIMQILWLLSFYAAREPDALTGLFVSGAVILLANPFAIADIGFLLSFFATLGILLYVAPLRTAITKRLTNKNRMLKRFISGTATIFAMTICAQIFILPIQAVFFREISLISPLSNLLVLWSAQYAFMLGAAAAIFGMIWLPLGIGIGWIVQLLCGWILWIVPLLAKIPFAAISARNEYVILFLLFIYGLFLLTRLSKRSHIGLITACTFAVAAIIFTASAVGHFYTSSVSVISAGSSQIAAVIQRGSCVVFNCGGSGDYAANGLETLLWEQGQRDVDIFAVSSYRKADCGNAAWLMTHYPVKTLLLPQPQDEDEQAVCDTLRILAEEKRTTVTYVSEDTEYVVGEIDINIYVNQSDDADHGRLLLTARADTVDLVMLPAIQPENLGRMLVENGITQADILAMGDTYSSRGLIGSVERLNPTYAVVTTYYEPSPSLIADLSACGAEVIWTQRQGYFTLTSPRIYKIPE